VATQVALSLVLLFGALLFVRSLHNLLTVDAGFKPEGLITLTIDFSKAQYPKERRLAIYHELSDRLSAIPGIVSLAQAGSTPVSGSAWDNLVGPDAAPAATSGKESFFSQPGPGYFRTMGTPVIAGREFNDRDTPSSPKVAIVNQMFARTFFGGANPVGHTFHMAADAGQAEPSFQIVGLVRNTKYGELREDFRPIAFFPLAQEENPSPSAMFVLRTAGPPAPLISAAKLAVAALSPSFGIEFRQFSAQLQESLLQERLMATLSGGFGFLAALLATLGLYGVMAYMVAQRRNEIGVRIALGADRTRVIRLILREAILLLSLGITAGVILALWAGKATATLLFGLPPHDAVSLAAASALLITIALIASYLPARRAAALDPVTALRSE
jgi:putative ABC transport system permease protein